MSVLLGESATHSHLSEPPTKPNLSQHNGTFGILTDFETGGNLSVQLGESVMHSHLSKPPTKPNLSQDNGTYWILTGFKVAKGLGGTEGIQDWLCLVIFKFQFANQINIITFGN